jgi:LysR family glycine cleavage system transcriptional activator
MSELPPLTAVRAFEACARHLSFTKAANELGMTQAAVSYQIKLLEERLGTSLFERRPRQILLTEAGEKLSPEVTQAFDRLRTAFAQMRNQVDGMLTISCAPTFASQWLASHIGLFQLANPGLAVRIDNVGDAFGLAADIFDVAIFGTAQPPAGLVSHLLLKAEFTPMLSPKVLEQYRVDKPADLLGVPHISPDDPWFGLWLKSQGVTGFDLPPQPITRLGSQHLEAVATMAGRGIGMLTPAFYREELAAGRLVQPFEATAWDGDLYFLAYAESRRNMPKIKAFRDWILKSTETLRS